MAIERENSRHSQNAYTLAGYLRDRKEIYLKLTRRTRDWFRRLSRMFFLRLCRVIWGHPGYRLAILRRAVEEGFLHLAFGAFCHGIYAMAATALLAHLVRIVWSE